MTEFVAMGECLVPSCKALVALKKNKRGEIYYTCNGNDDPRHKGCNFRGTFGKQVSMKIIKEASKPDEADQGPKPDPKPEPEPDTGTGSADRDWLDKLWNG